MTAPVVQVGTIGKSSGATTMASLLGCAAVDYGVRVVVVELDPSGGDLVGRLRANSGRRVSAFCQQVDASSVLGADEVDIGDYVIETFDGGPGVVVSDPYGAGNDPLFGVGNLGSWVAAAGWDCVVVDTGRVTPSTVRSDCALFVACVDVVTATDLDRAKRGCEALRGWLPPDAEMVVVVVKSEWKDDQVREHLDGVERWRVTNVGPERSVRKAWGWLRSGDWLAAREAKGFVRLRQFATPLVSAVESSAGADDASAQPSPGGDPMGGGPTEDGTLVGGDEPGDSGLPPDWLTATEGDEKGTWHEFIES